MIKNAISENTNQKTSSEQNHAYGTFFQLFELARNNARMSAEDGVIFSLAWLSVGRMLHKNLLPGFSSMQNLLDPECWDAAKQHGLPDEAVKIVWGAGFEVHESNSFRARASGLIIDFISQHGNEAWNLVDSIWDANGALPLGRQLPVVVYDSGLCDLMFELINAPRGASILIPFDMTGQLIIRAIRKGLKVNAKGPGWNWPNPITRLLITIEKAGNPDAHVDFEVSLDEYGMAKIHSDYLIACPPMGSKVMRGAGWGKFEGGDMATQGAESIYRRFTGRTSVILDRSDSWAIAALWSHIEQRAVFLTSPGLLYAKGQEQRLREFMLLGEKQPTTVISLPAKQTQGTNITGAITVLDHAGHNNTIRMIDASSCVFETKSTMRFSRILDTQRVVNLAMNAEVQEGLSIDVPVSEIANQDFNLTPARYLLQNEIGAEDRICLGDLVEVIRAPVASKDATAITVQEIGIPDLDNWQKIKGPFQKTTTINVRKLADSTLKQGDIVLSIKGTVGKSGLVGDIPTVSLENLSVWQAEESVTSASGVVAPVVCSQSCIALRIHSTRLSCISLFLYLKSDDFKNQVEAFRVGAAVAHVNPTTILQDIKVPLTVMDDEKLRDERYMELCSLEAVISQALQKINDIRAEL